ncbi:MAG: GspH/FimT family pseudopilin [Halioglobus sp.]|nr:GspH/FimT family pseudopilin [Halioglobus sp.]
MDRKSLHGLARGFTLIELMIVLVVLATLVSVGMPLMQGQLARSRLQAESSRFLGAIQLARSEAVMRNLPVSICPSAMAITGIPECSGIYADGWIVFANPGKDSIVDADTDEVLQVFEALPAGFQLTNRSGTNNASRLVNYLPDGSAHSPRTFMFCPPQHSVVPSLSIVMNIVGRARLVEDWGECPAA